MLCHQTRANHQTVRAWVREGMTETERNEPIARVPRVYRAFLHSLRTSKFRRGVFRDLVEPERSLPFLHFEAASAWTVLLAGRFQLGKLKAMEGNLICGLDEVRESRTRSEILVADLHWKSPSSGFNRGFISWREFHGFRDSL